MLRISNYSLNYSRQIAQGRMTVYDFLGLCRQLGVDGASLHLQNLPDTGAETLKRIRRAYLDHGLSMAIFTVSTDLGRADHAGELVKAREATRVAAFLGAPLLRVFPGSPPDEAGRAAAFDRAAAGVRRVCEEAAAAGLPVGLQNHNHAALCRTGDEVIRFIKKVDHPNLTFVLDTGQWAGSKGASAKPTPDLRGADYLESIRQTASLARYVRVKFYAPAADGSEPWIDYNKVFDILRGVHYHGFLDMVYEPDKSTGEDIGTALPRAVGFLRRKIQAGSSA